MRFEPELFPLYLGSCPPNPACGNTLSVDFREVIAEHPVELFVGQRVNAQFILENEFEIFGPMDPIPPGEINFKETTDAIEFIVCP